MFTSVCERQRMRVCVCLSVCVFLVRSFFFFWFIAMAKRECGAHERTPTTQSLHAHALNICCF